MKKTLLLLTMISFSAVAVNATEPLLLEPLSPYVLSTTPSGQAYTYTATPANNGTQVYVNSNNGVTNAVYTPVLGENMIPQNAAAEGKPVPAKRQPRVRIQTKQRSQGNSYWNAGGKGTKSFF